VAGCQALKTDPSKKLTRPDGEIRDKRKRADGTGSKLANSDGDISRNIVCYRPFPSVINRLEVVGWNVGKTDAQAHETTGDECEAR
jgi:hypothetical protein